MARVVTRYDERGQLLLVAALGLGVLLVVLALTLSTAIHAETLSTSSTDIRHAERGAVHYQESAHRGVAGVITRVNENGGSSSDALAENLTTGIADWNAIAARRNVGDGAVTNVSLESATYGTRVVQDDGSQDFTDRNETADWTVAGSVSNVREFRMNVTEAALSETGNGTCTESVDCFTVEVENGSETWRMFVYTPDDSTTVSVTVVTPSGDEGVCSVADESVKIDATAGTLADEDCAPLSFAEGITAPYNVTYVNADAVAGSYELTVDRNLSSSPHFDTDESPYIEPAIYAANVSVTYRSPELTYETTIRVAPGENDA